MDNIKECLQYPDASNSVGVELSNKMNNELHFNKGI